MENRKKVSFVLPVYFEEECISEFLEQLLKSVETLPYELEFIIVNDGSTDKSLEICRGFAAKDPRINIINFTRNFGHQAALTAGYDNVTGDVVITMDTDLQDPVSLIPEMLQKWEAGNYVVYARRKNRRDPFIRRNVFHVYYWLFDKVSDVRIPRNVGDYRLVDKRVVEDLKKCREKYRYLRGMVAWFGYKFDYVDYDRPDREKGTSGYTWKKLLKLAFDGFTGFSLFPLKIAAYAGFFVIVSGIAMTLYLGWNFIVLGKQYPVYFWLAMVIYVFIGIQFILTWLLGEYIGRIQDEQKQRPLYVIDKIYKGDE